MAVWRLPVEMGQASWWLQAQRMDRRCRKMWASICFYFYLGGGAVTTTLVGSGTRGYADGVGTAALFNQTGGIELDSAGRLYVAEWGNHIVRQIDVASRITTRVRGMTGASSRARGGLPLSSTFSQPRGVDVDRAGNVCVADTADRAIRVLSGAWVAGSTTGAPGSSTAAGTNALFNLPSAVLVRLDALTGVLYVADTNNTQVRTIPPCGTHAVNTLATFIAVARGIALNPVAGVMCLWAGQCTTSHTLVLLPC